MIHREMDFRMFKLNFSTVIFFCHGVNPIAIRIGLIFFALKIGWCIAQPGIDIPDSKPFQAIPTIRLEGRIVFFDGRITKESGNIVSKLFANKNVTTISINSMGGDIDSAIDIATIIHEKKLNIIVRTVCASACANYIFPAGKTKYVGHNSYLLWHGSANSPQEQLEVTSDSASLSRNDLFSLPEFIKIKEKETFFYQRLKVNFRLPFCPQLQSNYQVKFPEKWFSYLPKDLEKFGIKDIHYATSASQWIVSMRKKHVIFGNYCN